ncbi:hypothetical protein [Zavarzinella formosa]|uniref:hypothetical protein n=1 Tax=Zavarzinella formosa TaxID=360055 RepID=UPI000316417E|nr:hypothetical protein [Zavarzinella formosa]
MWRPVSWSLFGGCLLLITGCGGSHPPAPIPEVKPAVWEHMVLVNESGEQFPPHLHNLVKDGWEVHLVTGGQPYVVSTTRTGEGQTGNTVKFTPRDYYLKRQK